MKQNKLFFGLATIAAAALSFAACSSDEPETSPKQQEAKTISFTSSLEGSKAGTRVAAETQSTAIASNVKIGIFATATGGTVENGTNASYTSNGSGGLTADGSAMTCSSETSAMSFTAYAPYNESWSSATTEQTFTVTADQSDATKYVANDLLYGTGSIESAPTANQQVALSFTHKLSQIKVVLTQATGASIDLSGATVTVKSPTNQVPFTPSGEGTVGTATGSAISINAGTGTTTYAIIPPQTISAGTEFINVSVGGHTIVASLGANQTFNSGGAYTFTITIGDFPTTPAATRTTLGTPTTSLNGWGDPSSIASVTVPRLYASTYAPINGANTEWDTNSNTFKYTATSNNFMKCMTFENGALVNYHSFVFTISDPSDGSAFRVGIFKDNNTSSIKTVNGTAGTYIFDLDNLGSISFTLKDVESIRFGGSNSGNANLTCVIPPSSFYVSTLTAEEEVTATGGTKLD